MPTNGGRRRAMRQGTASAPQMAAMSALVPGFIESEDDAYPHYEYWLVQRLERGIGWFGGKFSLDYMGSAEYEFGASRRSLERIHAAGQFQLREIPVTRLDEILTVYFVAPEADFDKKLVDFQVWLEQDWPRSKESSYFPERFNQSDRSSCDFGWMQSTIAWWSFDDDIMWSLDRSVAEELLYGLENPAPRA